MKKILSVFMALLVAVFCAMSAGATINATTIRTNAPFTRPRTDPVPAGGRDLSRSRAGKDSITMTEEDKNCNWDGARIGDKKEDVNRKLAGEFPLMYELSAIGNMNLYSDREVPDHYLTVYFDEEDRMTMVVWQVNHVYSIDV